MLVPTPSMWGPGHPSLVGRGTQSRVGVRARRGAVVEIFLDTAPHMRGGVTPPLRGGRHPLGWHIIGTYTGNI